MSFTSIPSNDVSIWVSLIRMSSSPEGGSARSLQGGLTSECRFCCGAMTLKLSSLCFCVCSLGLYKNRTSSSLNFRCKFLHLYLLVVRFETSHLKTNRQTTFKVLVPLSVIWGHRQLTEKQLVKTIFFFC